jgi:hypothetical protein
MFTDWHDPEEHEHEWADESARPPEHLLGDPDAWRGDVHESLAEPWRGTVHLEDWPEWTAGPEYLMWKRLAEDES